MSEQGELSQAFSWQDIEDVLSLPPDERKNIEKLFPWFRERSTLFHQLSNESLTGVIQFATLIRVKPDYVIMHQGQKGDCFYIIVHGSAVVHAKKLDGAQFGNIRTVHPDVSFVKGNKDRLRFGQPLAVLGPGRCFGELSVISRHIERNATVISEEACTLVSINRHIYAKYVPHELSQELVRRSAFVATHPLFRTWASGYRNLLAETLHFRRLKYGEKLVTQGQNVDAVYFILEGEVTIKMNPIKHHEQFPRILAKTNSQGTKKVDDIDELDPHKQISVMERRRLRQRVGYYACEKRYRDVNVCIIGADGIIGDIEAILDLPRYTITAECLQDLQLYEIDKPSFMRIIVRKNPETHEKMRRLVYNKILLRDSLCPNSLPINKTLLTFFQKAKPKDNREKIIENYREKNSGKKPVTASCFIRLSRGKSQLKSTRKGILQLQLVKNDAQSKLDLWKNTGAFAAKMTMACKKKALREEPIQYSADEYKILKKQMQAMGKLTKKVT